MLEMDREQMRAWKARWAMVDEVIREERRRATFEERAAALFQIVGRSRELGMRRERTARENEEIASVRERFARLRAATQ